MTAKYKYLGSIINDHLTFDAVVEVFSESASRALGAVLIKVKLCHDLGYKTYTQLFLSCALIFNGSKTKNDVEEGLMD